MDIEWHSSRIEPRGPWRVRASGDGRPLSWKEVLDAWAERPGFGRALSDHLAALPPPAFRWETPAATVASLDQAFESVVVEDPSIDSPPDPEPFAEHLERAGDRTVIRFANLGGDATLVVPCPLAPSSAYVHLAAFVRNAPADQQEALWREVALAMRERLGHRPVWLNTAGGGVAWLHVRLDDRPKYYAHSPYRADSQP